MEPSSKDEQTSLYMQSPFAQCHVSNTIEPQHIVTPSGCRCSLWLGYFVVINFLYRCISLSDEQDDLYKHVLCIC